MMWPFKNRKGALLCEALTARSQQQAWAMDQLTRAAGQPEPPEPHLLIKLPIEGGAEVRFIAANCAELRRLTDWLDNSRYAEIADSIRQGG